MGTTFGANQSFLREGCLKRTNSFFNQRAVFNHTLIHEAQIPKNILLSTFRKHVLMR